MRRPEDVVGLREAKAIEALSRDRLLASALAGDDCEAAARNYRLAHSQVVRFSQSLATAEIPWPRIAR